MTLRPAITAEQVIADPTNEATIQYPAEQKKQITETIDLSALRPNHRIFEWDVSAGMIQPAQIVEETVLIGRKKSYKSFIEFIKKPGCHYTPALNAQNAERRFNIKFGIK